MLIAAVELIVQQPTLITKTAEMSTSARGQFVYFMCIDIALILSTEVSEKYLNTNIFSTEYTRKGHFLP